MPSIFDNVLNKLFPAREELYGGLLGPEDIQAQRGQALSRVGQSLLQTGGPHPTGSRNIGQNIGEALGAAKFPEALDEAAQHAAAFKQIAQQGATQRAIQAIAAAHPAKPGATPDEEMSRFESMIPDLISAGLTEQAAKLQDLVIKSRPGADKFTTLGPGQQLIQTNAPGGPKAVLTAPPKATPSEAFDQSTKLRTEFTGQAQEYANVANGYRTLKSFAGEPKRTGTTDQGVVFAYMKMLDPRSTLQNGQRADQNNAPGVPKEIAAVYNLLLGHETKLTQAQYDDILRAADVLLKTRGSEFYRLKNRYEQLATSSELDPSHVVTDYFEGLGVPKPGATSNEGDRLLNGAK